MDEFALRILGPEGAAMVDLRCRCHRILITMPASNGPRVRPLPRRGTYTVTGAIVICEKCHLPSEITWKEAA
jgi:hypothetical protein